MKNQRTLILITNHFPFGPYEAFLEHEIPYLQRAFDKVIIVARDVTSKEQRVLQGIEVRRINPVSDQKEKLLTAWLFVANAPRIIADVVNELKWLSSIRKSATKGILAEVIHTLAKALITGHHLERIIKAGNISGQVTLYSYWLTSSALATSFVSSNSRIKVKRISRAHGGDIYEQRTPLNYLPLRSTLARELDGIFTISSDGCKHLQRQLKEPVTQKIKVSRLGVIEPKSVATKVSNEFLIVSCSFLVAVKRIELLIDALEMVRRPFKWIHIGDGPLRPQLEELARTKLRHKNIQYAFTGNFTSTELYEFYHKNYVDLFVNTSSSEGIPVSMMEAQSFGIPIIAPAVGGIPEIVSSDCGRLFPADAKPQLIADKIAEVLSLSADSYYTMRAKAHQNWRDHYNAGKNFSTFADEILNL